MASTVTAILARFQRRFRQCEATYAQTLFDDAHRTILKKCEVRNTTRTITLTASTRQYDLNAAVFKVHEAYYETSSDPGDWTQLTETNLSKLVNKSPGWRAGATDSTPTLYYITSAVSTDTAKNQIGFDPIPDTTTSGGYPRVQLYVTEYAALSGSETVPENLLDEFYALAAKKRLEANAQHVENLQANGVDFEIIPTFTQGLGRVF
jgi:hypothetical protein